MKIKDFVLLLSNKYKVEQADINYILINKFNSSLSESILDPDRLLDSFLIDQIIEQLKKNVPIPYIVGVVDFLDVKILVNPDVLIPRQETEELVYKIREENSSLKDKELNILDLCSGSGCIGISLLKYFNKSKVSFVDISSKTFELVKESLKLNKIDLNRVKFIESNYLDSKQLCQTKFDIVVSNPPYVSFNEERELEIAYEPRIAIFCEDDGYSSYIQIFNKIEKVINNKASIYFEIGDKQSSRLKKEFFKSATSYNYSFDVIKDLSNKDRFLFIKRLD